MPANANKGDCAPVMKVVFSIMKMNKLKEKKHERRIIINKESMNKLIIYKINGT